MVSNKVSWNNGKYCRYTVAYQVDGTLIRLFIKTLQNMFSYGVSQYNKNSVYTISFNVSEANEWVPLYKKIWNKVESQLFEKLTTEPIKAKYIHGKLKMWKECIKTNFHGQEVSYGTYCNATAVLKIDSVYKQGKNYHPQVYVEECKYTDAGNQQFNMMMMMIDFLRCKREAKKHFVTRRRVTKLITNKQHVAVRTCKKVEYTPSKLYKNKGRA